MASNHLDIETYRRLRSGRLDPKTARALAEHLDGDCAICEALIASLPVDGLDGVTDAAVTQLAPARPEEAGNDMEFARIRRAVRPRRSAVSFVSRYAAIAATVLVIGGGGLYAVQHARTGSDDQGIKGREMRPVPAKLRFAVVEGSDGAPQLDAGRSGAVVPQGSSLAFRVEVGRPAYVALLRVGPGESSEVVWRQHVARPGAVDVSENGRPAAYPLRGLMGTQRFVLVASEHPIEDSDLGAAATAAKGASASREDPRFNVMTLDFVDVTVR
jgi:hypothetical protein